jgi:surface protein
MKTALIGKGVTPTGGLSTYADAINRIESGGSVKLAPNTMFGGSHTITYIPNIDTSEYTTMYGMFSECYQLTNVPLFDTSNVTDMSFMFEECNSLQSVPLFDTSNVTDMSGMFSMRIYDFIYPHIPASQLVSVPLFDTSKVTDMSGMFQYCVNLQSVPLFDTSKVTDMSYMFSMISTYIYPYNPPSQLASVPLFDTSKVTSMYGMFQNCLSLQHIGGLKDLGKVLMETPNDGLTTDRVFEECHHITRESCLNIFNNLYDITNNPDGHTPTLAFEREVIARLSAEDILIAVQKGWVISSY